MISKHLWMVKLSWSLYGPSQNQTAPSERCKVNRCAYKSFLYFRVKYDERRCIRSSWITTPQARSFLMEQKRRKGPTPEPPGECLCNSRFVVAPTRRKILLPQRWLLLPRTGLLGVVVWQSRCSRRNCENKMRMEKSCDRIYGVYDISTPAGLLFSWECHFDKCKK